MRLTKTFLSAAALMSLGLAACTAPVDVGRSEENRRMIDAEFGAVGPKSNPAAFKANGRNGAGFSLTRLYSEKPMPNTFSAQPPERFDNTLVVDFGVDIRIEDQFPIYRIGMDPTKISDRRAQLWPSHVLVEGPAGQLAARLPEVRAPGLDGMIWSDWTYCADCFGLEDIRSAGVDEANEAFASINAAYQAAGTRNGAMSPYVGKASFTVSPGVGILVGEAAMQMAVKASDVVGAAQARIAEMGPARDAYQGMIKDFAATSSPVNQVARLCGVYEPNRDAVNPALEKARVEAYVDCGSNVIENYNVNARQAEVAKFRIYERDLAKKAGLSPEQRMTFPTAVQESKVAQDAINQSVQRYNAFAAIVSGQPLPAASVPHSNTVEVLKPRPLPQSVAKPAADLEKLARTAIDRAADTTVAEVASEPPSKSVYFVGRLLNDGANMTIGDQNKNCIGDLKCETGSIISLIAATGYCEAEGETTKTAAGWGLVVQRYQPTSPAEEKKILVGDGVSKVHVVMQADKPALTEGLKATRALTRGGDQIFFATYPEFYEVNNDAKKCKDMWRDAAKVRVIENPSEIVD